MNTVLKRINAYVHKGSKKEFACLGVSVALIVLDIGIIFGVLPMRLTVDPFASLFVTVYVVISMAIVTWGWVVGMVILFFLFCDWGKPYNKWLSGSLTVGIVFLVILIIEIL